MTVASMAIPAPTLKPNDKEVLRLRGLLQESLITRNKLRRTDPSNYLASIEAVDARVKDLLEACFNGQTPGIVAALKSSNAETYWKTLDCLADRGFDAKTMQLIRSAAPPPETGTTDHSKVEQAMAVYSDSIDIVSGPKAA